MHQNLRYIEVLLYLENNRRLIKIQIENTLFGLEPCAKNHCCTPNIKRVMMQSVGTK